MNVRGARTWWSEMQAIAARHGRRGGAASDATDDLAQDLAVAALEQRAAAGRPGAWLERVGRNAAIDRWRTERRRAALLAARAPAAGAALDPESALLAREVRRQVRRALLALPRAQRRAALLRFHCGLPFGAVAAELGTETATARTRVHRALASLRARVQGLRALFVGWTGAAAPAAALGLAVLVAAPPARPDPGPAPASRPRLVAQAAKRAPQRPSLPPAPEPLPVPAAPVAAVPAPPPAAHRRPAADQVSPRQEFKFDDDEITADRDGPGGTVVQGRPRTVQPSLIELRRHFVPEILKSLEEL